MPFKSDFSNQWEKTLSCLLRSGDAVLLTELHICSQVSFTGFNQSLTTVLSFSLCKALPALIGIKPMTCVLVTQLQQIQLMGPDSKPAFEIRNLQAALISCQLSGKWKEELQGQECANLTFCQECFERVWVLYFCFKLYMNQLSSLTTKWVQKSPYSQVKNKVVL